MVEAGVRVNSTLLLLPAFLSMNHAMAWQQNHLKLQMVQVVKATLAEHL
jgi:hypothetical protein